jgi:hypothetical protein
MPSLKEKIKLKNPLKRRHFLLNLKRIFLSPRGSSIGCESRLMKRRSQVRIPHPYPCVDMSKKKKKKTLLPSRVLSFFSVTDSQQQYPLTSYMSKSPPAKGASRCATVSQERRQHLTETEKGMMNAMASYLRSIETALSRPRPRRTAEDH